MHDVIDRAGLPSYARFVDDRRGWWRRLSLSVMLRMTVKRQWRPDVDVVRLREQQAEFDAKFGVLDREARRMPQDCDGAAAEWIDVPETRPGRVLLYFHGGAFILRFPVTHAGLLRACAAAWARAR